MDVVGVCIEVCIEVCIRVCVGVCIGGVKHAPFHESLNHIFGNSHVGIYGDCKVVYNRKYIGIV